MLDILKGASLQSSLRYDYTKLDATVRETIIDAALDIRQREKRAATDIVEIGRRLLEVRDIVEHGCFLEWIDTEFGWQRSTAYNFMNVADKFPKFGNLDNFGLSAVYLLSGPSVPDTAIAEAKAVAETQPVTHAVAKRIVAQHRPARRPVEATAPLAQPTNQPIEPAREPPRPLVELDDIRQRDKRLPLATAMRDVIGDVIRHMNSYGELTGCFTDIPPAERALKKMQGELQKLIDILEGDK